MCLESSRVTIIIPVFNDWDRLLKVLPFYSSLTGVEVVIVDNGSEWVPEVSYSNVKVLICEKPGSYSARNYALRQAESDLYVFTDSDCIPSEGWMTSLLDMYVTSNGLVAGRVEMFPAVSDRPGLVESYDIVLGLPQERYVSKGYAVTANLLVPSRVFSLLGLFDEARMSGGDAELCRRAVGSGVPLTYASEATVGHPARARFSEIAKKIKRVNSARVTNGLLKERVLNLFKCVTPPFHALLYIKTSPKSFSLKWRAFLVLFLLWPVGAWFALSSFVTGKVQR